MVHLPLPLRILFLEQSSVRYIIGYAPKDIYGILRYVKTTKQTKNMPIFWSATANTRLPHFNENQKHFLCSLSKKFLCFTLCETIGRLRHHLNHLGGDRYDIHPLTKRFNFTCKDHKKLFYKLTYVNGKHFPDFTTFKKTSSLNFAISQSFIFDSTIKHLKNNLSFIHCVKFNNLKPDNVIKTIYKISNLFWLEWLKDKMIFFESHKSQL